MTNLFISVTAGVLGYMFISPFIMTREERKEFETKIDEWIEKSDKEGK